MPPEGMTSRFASAGESPGFLLWRISNAWQQRQRAALQPLGLTHVQFVLLASLVWLTQQQGTTVTQTDLAEQAQTDLMMTSQVVRALEARGLLTRATSAQDRRARVLSPTAEGMALAAAAIRVVEAVDADCFVAGDVAWLQGIAQRMGLPGVADERVQPSTEGDGT
jgi:DNA-binding MarR family transcriptional regulator